MKTHAFLLILISFSVLFFVGCKEDEQPAEPELKVTLDDPTNVTETSFTANWTVNKTNIQSCQVEISLQSDFTDIFKTIAVNDPLKTSQPIDGLIGATKYYYRIKITLDDGTNGTSDNKNVSTYYTTEFVDVTTSDGINIAGKICYLGSNATKKPGVMLLGVAGLPNLWKNEETFNNLVALGYVCYIFDWRGQGQSDYWPPIEHIDSLNAYVSGYYKNDLQACYTYFKQHDKVDSTKIAISGGSLGANLSLIANNWNHVQASVALSPSKMGYGLEEPLQNVLFIVCEKDSSSSIGFSYYRHTLDIYENALEPKKLIVLPGEHHGLEVLGLPGINKEVTDWINARMED